MLIQNEVGIEWLWESILMGGGGFMRIKKEKRSHTFLEGTYETLKHRAYLRVKICQVGRNDWAKASKEFILEIILILLFICY